MRDTARPIPGHEAYSIEPDGTVWRVQPFPTGKMARTTPYALATLDFGRKGYSSQFGVKLPVRKSITIKKLLMLTFGELPVEFRKKHFGARKP